MLAGYFVIFFLSLLLTLPLGSKRIAYAPMPEYLNDYSALRGLGRSAKTMIGIMFVIILAMMVLECIFKDELILDYPMYERVYNAGAHQKLRRGIEPTYGWITAISPTFLVLLGIYAIISCSTHLWGILRNSPNIFISMMIYLSFSFVLHDMIQIRGAVAAGIFLIAIRFIVERNWLAYYALIIIAIFFHYSALIFLPVYFFPHKRMSRLIWGGILMLAMVMALFDIQIGSLSRYIPLQIVEKYLESYLGNREHVAATLGPWRIIICLLTLLMIIKINEIQKRYPYAIISITVFVCSQICYLLFGDIAVLQSRLGEMFGMAGVFVWAMFPYLSKRYYYLLFIVPIAVVAYNIPTIISLLTQVSDMAR